MDLLLHLQVLLSTRPEKSVGTDAIWQQAEAALQDALTDMGWKYAINEADGAFYGECACCCAGLQAVGCRVAGAGGQWPCSRAVPDPV